MNPIYLFDPRFQITLVAENVKALRRADVERVLTEGLVSAEDQGAMAAFIKRHRPDLSAEVDELMADLDIAIAPATEAAP